MKIDRRRSVPRLSLLLLVAAPLLLSARVVAETTGQMRRRPEIGFVAAYRRDGALLPALPQGDAPADNASGLAWLQPGPVLGDLAVAVPFLLLSLLAAWDIRNLRRREAAMTRRLVQQNDELRRAGRMKSDFLANVSHDLRTPLTGLHLTLSGLLDPALRRDDDQTREYLRTAIEEVDLLSARVGDLLEMSRLEAGVVTLRMEPADMTEIVGSALARMQALLSGVEIQVEFPPEPLLVFCDQRQIETAIVNLLENAVKYAPPGAPLHLRGERRGERVIVWVRDRGPGIAPGDEGRVFEKFYRSASAAGEPGTGLGLAICKAILETHGGLIGAQSAPEGGAAFWFSLAAFPQREEKPL
jgi:two-component system sensor histidine kinase KdpD